MLKFSFRGLTSPLICLVLAFSGWAQAADPPSRVARLAYVSGGASFSPGGEGDWGRAIVNRPMVTGDRLWVERGARAELQLGAAAIRVGGSTSLTLLNLDDRIAQVELEQGTLNIRVRRLDRGQIFEVATPQLAYSIRRPGSYRIQVSPDGDSTTVTVRSGAAEVYGEGRAFTMRDRQTLRFYDSGLRDYQSFASWPTDEFDRWSSGRDRRWDNSPSRRYVSADLIGYEDLDQHGTWRQHRDHGSVWVPRRVAADWAPYRDGQWSWIEPWGWTWVDEAPWGFAPSHYGRWAHIDGGWAWVPGPAKARAVYAPALVAFVAGSSLQQGGTGAVGWFPLGPREVYRPSYSASREYFSSVNTSNTVITQVHITNVYNNVNVTSVTYANQQVPGAVVAVLAAAFVQSRPVARETVRVSREMVARAPVAAVAPVAPVRASVVGPAAAPSVRPPERARHRPVVAQTAPPPAPVPFAARQSALAANAGKPLDAAAVAALKPAAPASAPSVKVVAVTPPVAAPARPASAAAPAAPPRASQASEPARAAPPPPVAAASSARESRGARSSDRNERGQRPAPAAAAVPAAPATPAVPALAATPAAPATPATPAARATPAAPVTPSEPATPATRATPATPAAKAVPAAPAQAAASAAAGNDERRPRNAARGRDTTDDRPGGQARPSGPPDASRARPPAAAAPVAPAPVAAAPAAAPPAAPAAPQPTPAARPAPAAPAAPRAAAAQPPARPASATPAAGGGQRAERAAARREAASGERNADERRRKREDEDGRKP